MAEKIEKAIGTVLAIASAAMAVYHTLLNDRYEAEFFFLVAIAALAGCIWAYSPPESKLKLLINNSSISKKWAIILFLLAVSAALVWASVSLYNKSKTAMHNSGSTPPSITTPTPSPTQTPTPPPTQTPIPPPTQTPIPPPTQTPTPPQKAYIKYPIKFLHEMDMEDAEWQVDGVRTYPSEPPLPSMTVLLLSEGHHRVLAKASSNICATDIFVPVPKEQQGITLKCHPE